VTQRSEDAFSEAAPDYPTAPGTPTQVIVRNAHHFSLAIVAVKRTHLFLTNIKPVVMMVVLMVAAGFWIPLLLSRGLPGKLS